MPDTRQVLHNVWANTPISDDDSIVEQHVKNFVIYAVGIALLVGTVSTLLLAALGPIGAILALPLNLYAAYKVASKLFIEVDALVTRRIRRREGNLAENLSE